MAETTTPELNLVKAVVGSNEPFRPDDINANWDKVDGPFNQSSGHNHDGAHQGAPINRIASGGLTVVSGGVVVQAGGLTVTANGISVSSGGLQVTGGITIASAGMTVSAGGITVSAGGITVSAGGLVVTGLTQALGTGANALAVQGHTSDNTTTAMQVTNAGSTALMTVWDDGSALIRGPVALGGGSVQYNRGVLVGSGVTASGGEAEGIELLPTLTASGNGDILAAMRISAGSSSFALGGHTSVVAAALYIDAVNPAAAQNYGIRIAAPGNGTSDNVALSAAGDVILGGGALGSGLGTTDTVGFVFIPAMAGTPTGAPATTNDHANHIPVLYDTSTNKIWARNGGTWRATAALT